MSNFEQKSEEQMSEVPTLVVPQSAKKEKRKKDFDPKTNKSDPLKGHIF